jgi:hypothetical protein
MPQEKPSGGFKGGLWGLQILNENINTYKIIKIN